MNANRFVGVTCGLIALVGVVAIGFCALSGAILTTAVAAGVGQTFQVAAEALPAWPPGTGGPTHHTLNPFLPDFAESLAERIVTTSDLYAQTFSVVRASSEAREVLGWPIEAEGGLQVRKYENSPWGSKADMTIVVRGPQASGALTVMAHRSPVLVEFDVPGIVATKEPQWVYDQLLLSLPGRQEHIDLLTVGR